MYEKIFMISQNLKKIVLANLNNGENWIYSNSENERKKRKRLLDDIIYGPIIS